VPQALMLNRLHRIPSQLAAATVTKRHNNTSMHLCPLAHQPAPKLRLGASQHQFPPHNTVQRIRLSSIENSHLIPAAPLGSERLIVIISDHVTAQLPWAQADILLPNRLDIEQGSLLISRSIFLDFDSSHSSCLFACSSLLHPMLEETSEKDT
jgi:hypothetical protein